jgi:hypothetical protein
MPPFITERDRQAGDERFATLTARRPTLEHVFARAAEAEPRVQIRRGVMVADAGAVGCPAMVQRWQSTEARMRSLVAVVALGASVACAFGGEVAAAPAASRCRLHGQTLVQNKQMRIVRHRLDGGAAQLEGCVFRVGRIRKLGYSQRASTTTETARLEHVAATYAAVRTTYSSQYGDGEALTVIDVATGHRYTVFAWRDPIESPLTEHPSVKTSFLNAHGQVAAAVVTMARDANGTETATRVQIVGYGARGKRLVLDSGTPEEISASSLRLSGATASWSHAGQRQTRDLPA